MKQTKAILLKVLKIVMSLLVILVAVGLIRTAPRWWWRVFMANVYLNGKQSQYSRVYFRGRDLLICVDEPKGSAGILCYRVTAGSKSVYVTGGAFISHLEPLDFELLPIAAIQTHIPIIETRMNTAKIDVDPRLKWNQGSVNFESFYGTNVRVML